MVGGVHVGGHAWQGVCVVGGVHAGETATEAGGTHHTGMHSCLLLNLGKLMVLFTPKNINSLLETAEGYNVRHFIIQVIIQVLRIEIISKLTFEKHFCSPATTFIFACTF